MRPRWITVLGSMLACSVASAKASPTDVEASYYRKYTCQQLFDAARKASARAVAVANEVKDARVSGAASAGDVIVVPKAVSVAKPVSAELGLLKQRLLAIQDASIQSQCEIEFLDPGR